MISDNWWNTKKCLEPNGVNHTNEVFGMEKIMRMFNKSLTFNNDLDTNYFNKSYMLQDKYFKNDSQLTDFCHVIKSLSVDDEPNNFTAVVETNNSLTFLHEELSVDLLDRMRHCFNATTVTPAEEYWECVECIMILCFGEIFTGWDVVVGEECSC